MTKKTAKSKKLLDPTAPIPEGAKIENKHNATVKVSNVYNKQPAKPGYIWFTWQYVLSKREGMRVIDPKNQAGQKFMKPKTNYLYGGCQVQVSFVKEHGIENVTNMVIMNIINKI